MMRFELALLNSWRGCASAEQLYFCDNFIVFGKEMTRNVQKEFVVICQYLIMPVSFV